MHQRGGSLNIQELYSHYHSKTKNGVNAAQAVIASSTGAVSNSGATRVGNHQPVMTTTNATMAMQNNLMTGTQFNTIGAEGQNQQQLFLPGNMKMHVMKRKQPVTQHQQHRSHSVNNQVALQSQ